MKEKRPRGRPKVQVEYCPLHFRVPKWMFDELDTIRKERMLSMNSIMIMAIFSYLESNKAQGEK